MFSFLAAVTHTSGCGKQQMCLDRQVSGPSSEEPAFKPPLLLASDGQAGGSILTGTALIERSTQPSAAKNSVGRSSTVEKRHAGFTSPLKSSRPVRSSGSVSWLW